MSGYGTKGPFAHLVATEAVTREAVIQLQDMAGCT
jgi:hypothetical protein